jgi:hypothetical protein
LKTLTKETIMKLAYAFEFLFVCIFMTAPMDAVAAAADGRADAPAPRKATSPAKEEPREASSKAERDAADGKGEDDDDAKVKDIRRLLKATGAGELGVQAFKQVQSQFKRTFPQVPETFWTEFEKEVKADDLVEMVVPIYAKYLTHDDVKELIKFYESPVGRKLVKVQPKVMGESMQAGQKWGAAIAEKVMRRLKAEGYIAA